MLDSLAASNLQTRLKENPYPGRGLILGRNLEGAWVQVYWIMGRSEQSRNRVFKYEKDILRTEAADPSKVQDPSLIIYNAMREANRHFIVTNGSQTDVLYEGLHQGLSFSQSLKSQQHEPDAPHFTPRISGDLDLTQETGEVWLSMIKASATDSNYSEYHFFHYPFLPKGYGYGLTTYQNNGNPLPSFQGTPCLLPLQGNASDIAITYWNVLNEDNKIALAVRLIRTPEALPEVVILNKYAAPYIEESRRGEYVKK